MRSFLVLASFIALAGRALALNIAVGGAIGNLTALGMLNVSDSAIRARCQEQCTPAHTAVQACADDTCLCANSTATAIVAYEQCMFNVIIATNDPAPDPKAGSTSVLTAYAAACQASVNATLANNRLVLPDEWNGPVAVSLGAPATAVVVGMGALLGAGAVFILSSMR